MPSLIVYYLFTLFSLQMLSGALLGGVQNDKVHCDFAICCLFCMLATFSTKLHSLEMELSLYLSLDNYLGCLEIIKNQGQGFERNDNFFQNLGVHVVLPLQSQLSGELSVVTCAENFTLMSYMISVLSNSQQRFQSWRFPQVVFFCEQHSSL